MDTLDRDVTGVDREQERGHTSVNPRDFSRTSNATASPPPPPPASREGETERIRGTNIPFDTWRSIAARTMAQSG